LVTVAEEPRVECRGVDVIDGRDPTTRRAADGQLVVEIEGLPAALFWLEDLEVKLLLAPGLLALEGRRSRRRSALVVLGPTGRTSTKTARTTRRKNKKMSAMTSH